MREILEANPALFDTATPYDMVLTPDQITLELAEELDRMAPFGKDNPSPAFLLESVKLLEYDVVGSGKALRIRIANASGGLGGICFGSEDKIRSLAEICSKADCLRLVCHIECNTFNGQKRVQLRLAELTESVHE